MSNKWFNLFLIVLFMGLLGVVALILHNKANEVVSGTMGQGIKESESSTVTKKTDYTVEPTYHAYRKISFPNEFKATIINIENGEKIDGTAVESRSDIDLSVDCNKFAPNTNDKYIPGGYVGWVRDGKLYLASTFYIKGEYAELITEKYVAKADVYDPTAQLRNALPNVSSTGNQAYPEKFEETFRVANLKSAVQLLFERNECGIILKDNLAQKLYFNNYRLKKSSDIYANWPAKIKIDNGTIIYRIKALKDEWTHIGTTGENGWGIGLDTPIWPGVITEYSGKSTLPKCVYYGHIPANKRYFEAEYKHPMVIEKNKITTGRFKSFTVITNKDEKWDYLGVISAIKNKEITFEISADSAEDKYLKNAKSLYMEGHRLKLVLQDNDNQKTYLKILD